MEEKYLDNEKLSKNFINDYNLLECTTISYLIMKKYKRLVNSCLEEPTLRVTSNYEPIYSEQTSVRNNTMNIIDKHLDDLKDYSFMKQKIFNLMNIMSKEEKACFTEMFLYNKPENMVSKIVGRSRQGLKSIIESCVVRTVLAFHLEVMKNETRNIDETKEIELIYY